MNSENNLLELNTSKTPERSRRRYKRSNIESNVAPKTPLRNTIEVEQPKMLLSSVKDIGCVLTPRRSARKSIKPAQDYDEIVLNRRAMRSQNVITGMEKEEHKWTPAKVGRVSQKRKGRSGKKSNSVKKRRDEEDNEQTSEDSEGKSDELVDSGKTSENTAENALNTTFDMEEETVNETQDKNSLEESKEELPKVDLEPMEQNYEMQCNDTDVITKVESHKDSVQSVVTPKEITDDLVKESSQLGCTPIVYDDNNDVKEYIANEEKGQSEKVISNVKEPEGCTPILVDETLGKISLNSIDVENENIVDEVFEEPKKNIEIKETLKEDVKTEQEMVYESIEVLSDDSMVFLVLSDDEEIQDSIKEKKSLNKPSGDEAMEDKEKNKEEGKKSLNGTFDLNDCIVISPGEERKESENLEVELDVGKSSLAAAAEKVKELQENYFSPRQKPFTNPPKILLTNDKDSNKTLLSTPKVAKKRQNIGTPVSVSKRLTPNPGKIVQNTGTPLMLNKAAKRQPKGYRFPTPFKSKKDFRFDKQDEENENQNIQSSSMMAPEVLTDLEPKEIVLRSIRKRSLSVTIDGDQRKRKALNVTFYSPANQTATIDDLDDLIAKSAAKISKNTNGSKRRENGTQRKRSISLDDKYLRTQPSKLPRPMQTTPKMPRVTPRTKLPNFAAIHQQQFQKMENLVDYVARKAERAQNLTNSALKSRNVSALSPAGKKPKPTASKALVLSSSNKVTNTEKPLASILSKVNISYAETSKENISNKLNTRTQRHIEMFKGRPVDSKSSTRKNGDIIRGVRSNRRFELMMQHRKTSGN